MDTKQLPNYREHPSHILDIRKTHSVRGNPGERDCYPCRLQRSELIKSISFWAFYSQKGDWHPSGMAPGHRMPLPWGFAFPIALSTSYHLMEDNTDPLPISSEGNLSPFHPQKDPLICAYGSQSPVAVITDQSFREHAEAGNNLFPFLIDRAAET